MGCNDTSQDEYDDEVFSTCSFGASNRGHVRSWNCWHIISIELCISNGGLELFYSLNTKGPIDI